MARETAQTRVWWRGVQITARQRDAFREAERRLLRKYPGVSLKPTQGSWSSSVNASAGTHEGAGVVDFRTWHMTPQQRAYMVRCLKDVGQAAWYRTTEQGFDPHVHVCDRVTTNMAPAAVWQVKQFDLGRTGLASNRKDPTYRPSPSVKWSYKLGRPV